MEYVPVLGVAPSKATKTPVMHYFKDYLISMAEPTTSRNWTLQDIVKQLKKIERLKLPGLKLYLDSGGYQVITGYITENRIKEYTDVYHFILENFMDSFDYVFSLDINTPKFSQEKLIKYNDYSIDESIALIKKRPELRDKQLFVVQSRFPHILEDWLTLMDKHSTFLYYDRYSFGGLVSLKGETKVQFNHFVPMTMWLITYIKNRQSQDGNYVPPKQIHMLGQSSRVALLTGIILEKFTGVNITMDSSEVIRFSPIAAKVPLIHKQEDFTIVNNLTDMETMIEAHSDAEAEVEVQEMKKQLKVGKVSNQTFVELICQNLSNLISFGDYLLESEDINDIVGWQAEDFENFHDVFKIGRLSTEMANNMRLIRTLTPYLEQNDFSGIHSHVLKIIGNYYNGSNNRTGEL